MISRGIWVPGEVVATNRALSDQRAAGWAYGYREALVRMNRPTTPGRPRDRYAEGMHAMRARTAIAARASGLVAPADVLRLRFAVHGHPRFDVAGAYLAVKAMEDGLVDAGVIESDRFNVGESRVVVLRDQGPQGVYISMEECPCAGA